MRATVWRSKLCPSSPYPVLTLIPNKNEQILLDVNRTFSEEPWFSPHRDKLCDILYTFSVVNEGFGYPQGLNYLVFPLFYVYAKDNESTSVEDTFYSLQSLVRIVLPFYPLHSKDESALKFIQTISSIIRLKCAEADPVLRVLFGDDYVMFMDSLVSNVLPSMYANVFCLSDTLLLWDHIFEKNTCRSMFERTVEVLVTAILYHKKVFTHLAVHKCMQVFQTILGVSISACVL